MIERVTMKQARHLANLSQRQAADKIGISLNTLRNYEDGRSFPNAKVITNIERIYNVKYSDIDFLCDETN